MRNAKSHFIQTQLKRITSTFYEKDKVSLLTPGFYDQINHFLTYHSMVPSGQHRIQYHAIVAREAKAHFALKEEAAEMKAQREAAFNGNTATPSQPLLSAPFWLM